MSDLLYSGNIIGLFGLALIAWVGFRLVRTGHRGGWLVAAGALLFASAILYNLYAVPLMHRPLHLSFSHNMIALATAAPTLLRTLGFILMPLGLLLVVARQQKQLVRINS